MRRWLLTAGLLVLASCSRGETVDRTERALPQTMAVTSPAFREGAPIPRRYSCEGQNVAPPLRWSKPPPGTAQLALVVDDPDAPEGTFVHWVVVGMGPSVRRIGDGEIPPEARQVTNSADKPTYMGPCPPGADAHHYRFTVYALGRRLELRGDESLEQVLDAIERAALARGRLVGTFTR